MSANQRRSLRGAHWGWQLLALWAETLRRFEAKLKEPWRLDATSPLDRDPQALRNQA